MADYIKSKTTDFGGNFNQDQFVNEILTEGSISTTLESVYREDDVITIRFVSTLSGSEVTSLNTLVTNHVADFSKSKDNSFPVFPYQMVNSSDSWTKMGIFRWGGSDHVGTLDYIDVLSYMAAGATSYDVKVEDSTNGDTLIAQTNFTNTGMDICDLGTITNVPAEPAVFILYGKVQTGGNDMNIESINVYHDN